MPILMQLGCPHELLASCWVFSPLVGLFGQPLVGWACDHFGRRRFIVGFGIISGLGFWGVALAPLLEHRYKVLLATVLCYGVMDCANDLLITPTRALVDDIVPDPRVAASWCAVSRGFGKVVALMMCMSVIPHWDLAFQLTGVAMPIIALCSLGVDAPSKAMRAESTQALTEPLCRTDSLLSIKSNSLRSVNTDPADSYVSFKVLWLLNFTGWVSLCAWDFYCTAIMATFTFGGEPGSEEFAEGVKFATMSLAVHACLYVVLGFFVDNLMTFLRGPLRSLVFAHLVASLSFAAVCTGDKWCAFVGNVVLAIPTQVILNCPYTWVEENPLFTAAHRGANMGRLNTSFAAAQLLVSVFSGPLVQASGGHVQVVYQVVAFVSMVSFGLGAVKVAGGKQ